MKEYKLTETEEKFSELIWGNEPIGSGDLVKLCEIEMNWKKSTTYTMIRKLCGRNILKNENAIVTSLVKREQVQKYESEALLEKSFDNSLPAFIATFLQDKKLSKKEAEELKNMIEEASKHE